MRKIYGAYHKDPKEVEKSSSGGIYATLSDVIINSNGMIIGGGYNYVTQKLEHIVCKTPKERDALRGSKYFQSHIDRGIYEFLDAELNKDTPILFVGTPCQVDAIKQYAKIKQLNTENLITCDLLCHGVGSPGIWTRFLEYKNKNFDYISFKDKRKSWEHPLCIGRSGNKEISLRGYSWLYFSNAIMRPSCYKCKYAMPERVGDFTIGDFWKAKEKDPDIYNPKGTSFIMVNSIKGETFFNLIKCNLIYKEVTLSDVMQRNMKGPTRKPNLHDEIMHDYKTESAKDFFRKWQIKLLISKLKKKIAF